jgi:hypothetical protein
MRIAFGSLALMPLFAMGTVSAGLAADSGTAQLGVSGTAPAICSMASPSAVNSGNTAIQATNVTVTSLIKDTDATIQPWQATLNFPAVMCNYAAFLTISSQYGGMKIVGTAVQPVGGQFLTTVHYTVTAKWGPLDEITLDTAADGTDPVSIQAAGAVQGDLLVTIQSPASTLPLVQGDYQDTIFVKVGPTV